MYIEQGAQITFTTSQPVGSKMMVYMDVIFANLSEVTRSNGSVHNVTTTLTILLNKTNVSCLAAKEDNAISKSSSVLYFTGMLFKAHFDTFFLSDLPYLKNTSIMYQEKELYFTAVLELGDIYV